MVEEVKDLVGRVGDSIKEFAEDPINNLGFLIPMAICLTSIISGIVTYIMFIVNGGYSSQIDNIKSNGLDGLSDSFTVGTTKMMITGVTAKIVLGLVFVEFIVMLKSYFQNRGKGMRITMIVDLTIVSIMVVLSTVIYLIEAGYIVFTVKQIDEFVRRFDRVLIDSSEIQITYTAICIISIITFMILVLVTEESRWMLGYSALALVFAYVVMPLLFLFIQNIIPIVGWSFVFLICVLVVKIFVSMHTDHPDDIKRKKEELARAKELSRYYKSSAEQNYKEAREGLNIVFSAETKREWARGDLRKADYEDKEIKRLEEDIVRLESKFGKQE